VGKEAEGFRIDSLNKQSEIVKTHAYGTVSTQKDKIDSITDSI